MYFVMSGQLRVSKCQPDGKMGVVNVLGAGTSFGQMGCVQKDGRRGASCVALTNCELLCIHRYNFVRSSDPEVIASMREKAEEMSVMGSAQDSSEGKSSAGISEVLTTGRATAVESDKPSSFRAIKRRKEKSGRSSPDRAEGPASPSPPPAASPLEPVVRNSNDVLLLRCLP